MRPTRSLFSKASRLPLTGKRGNKDFYKGTGAASLPGGLRTGAPGKHVVGGKAKYRVIDEKVRYFVAPSIEAMANSPLKPYVSVTTKMTANDKLDLYGRMAQGGFDGKHYLRISSERLSEKDFMEADEAANVPESR
ncbi:hypothetical protein FRC03_012371 [Tulasnella sp. 419]|nr:hypothetical protein FRC03_012371 [Tulasnella sp. 419]